MTRSSRNSRRSIFGPLSRGRIALVIAIAVPSPAIAFTRAAASWNPAGLPVHYEFNLAEAPSELAAAELQAALDQGFASWSAPACTSFRTIDDGETATEPRSADGHNTLAWVTGSWNPALGDVSSTIGITTPTWQRDGNLVDADIHFNNVAFRWSLDGAPGTVDTQSIAAHEQGHFLGLDHSEVAHAIMFANYPGGIRRTLDADDIEGVCAVYPAAHSGTLPIGASCALPSDCASGVCIAHDPQPFCSTRCATDCECPGGFACVESASAGIRVCAPGNNTCLAPPRGEGTLGAACSGSVDCASGVCARAPGADAAFCAEVCVSDCSCPAGYACFPTSAAGVAVCARATGNQCPIVDAGPDGGRSPSATSGCGCRVPRSPGQRGGAIIGAGLAILFRSRHRSKRKRVWPLARRDEKCAARR